VQLARDLLELALWIDAAGYGVLLAYSFMYRDGDVWRVWRFNVLFGFLSGFLGAYLVHGMKVDAWGHGFALMCGVAIFRICRAYTSFLLAFHLRRMTQAYSGAST
jgi:hypothetical protein